VDDRIEWRIGINLGDVIVEGDTFPRADHVRPAPAMGEAGLITTFLLPGMPGDTMLPA